MIADVGTVDTLNDIGVHSKRVPALFLPTSCTHAQGPNPTACRNARHKMRPDRMSVKTTEKEQQIYLPNDVSTDTGLPNLPCKMPDGRARKVTIVEGGYCRDTTYLTKLEEKSKQHAAL